MADQAAMLPTGLPEDPQNQSPIYRAAPPPLRYPCEHEGLAPPPWLYPVCGDGVEQYGEECDMGELNGLADLCTQHCQFPYCGDGVAQGIEECDTGPFGTAACDGACKLRTGGDGDGVVGTQCGSNDECLPGLDCLYSGSALTCEIELDFFAIGAQCDSEAPCPPRLDCTDYGQGGICEPEPGALDQYVLTQVKSVDDWGINGLIEVINVIPASLPKPPMFMCENGDTVPLAYKNDGNANCADGSDEQFECMNGELVSLASKCDGHELCADGSDENGCPTFMCDDGDTVPLAFENNGSPDCADGSDEHPVFNCLDGSNEPGCGTSDDVLAMLNGIVAIEPWCGGVFNPPCPDSPDVLELPAGPDEGFMCMDGDVIPLALAYNGLPDCEDGSDEQIGLSFKCWDGSAVPLALKCDGVWNCLDGSDEMVCNFKCMDGNVIPLASQCNGLPDCVGGSDEIGCQGAYNDAPATQIELKVWL